MAADNTPSPKRKGFLRHAWNATAWTFKKTPGFIKWPLVGLAALWAGLLPFGSWHIPFYVLTKEDKVLVINRAEQIRTAAAKGVDSYRLSAWVCKDGELKSSKPQTFDNAPSTFLLKFKGPTQDLQLQFAEHKGYNTMTYSFNIPLFSIFEDVYKAEEAEIPEPCHTQLKQVVPGFK